jgi:hypothetical protein
MNYSKAHQDLAERNGTHEVYDNPENYLGPNYEAVLNFWWYLETLTKEQLLELEGKYSLKQMQYSNRYCEIVDHVEELLDWGRRATAASASRSLVRNIIGKFPSIPAPVTLELIALQTILDKGEELIFIPMLSF